MTGTEFYTCFLQHSTTSPGAEPLGSLLTGDPIGIKSLKGRHVGFTWCDNLGLPLAFSVSTFLCAPLPAVQRMSVHLALNASSAPSHFAFT